MIDLNLDLTYLLNRFEIKTQRVNQYSNRSIEELMAAEAKDGNQKAANFDMTVTNPAEIARIFRLSDPTNRLMIIRSLSSNDLKELLQYLGNDDLVWGLKYLTKDKLKELIEALPQEELLKMVLQTFSIDQIIEQMPESELDRFLQNTKIEKNDIMNVFEQMRQSDLQQLISQVFGNQTKDMSKDQILGMLNNLEDNDFNLMMQSFQVDGKKFITSGLIHNNPKLMFELDPKSIARPFMRQDPGDILHSIEKLDKKFIIPMVEELPEQLIQIIATQIKPEVFAEILADKFSDILKDVMV